MASDPEYPAVPPGFVDLQINGWNGVDFSSAELTPDAAATAFDAIVSTGTAAFLPTVVTSDMPTYTRVIPVLARLVQSDRFKGVALGIHLEGPFLDSSAGARGCHRADLIRKPDCELLRKLLDLGQGAVRLITVAANQPGVLDLIREARAAGVTVALGHHLASADDLTAAAGAGATMLTHLGNGLPNAVHRHFNPLLAGLGEPQLAASIITDGFHLPKSVIATTVFTKGTSNVAVVSDAVFVAGLDLGRYQWMGKDIILAQEAAGQVVRDGTEPCLAGSAASMLQCANHLLSLNVVTVAEVCEMCFETPLKLIGLTAADVSRPATCLAWDHQKCRFSIKMHT